MTRSLLVLSFCALVVSCATTPSFYGERRLAPSDIGKMLVLIDDRSDNAVLSGNEFLLLAATEKIPNMAVVVPRGIGGEIINQGRSGFRRRGNGRSP